MGVQREWSPNTRKVAIFAGPQRDLRGFITLTTPAANNPDAACTWSVTDMEGNNSTTTCDYLDAEQALLDAIHEPDGVELDRA